MSYKGGQYWSETVMETTGEPRRLALSTDRTTIAADDSELAIPLILPLSPVTTVKALMA